MPRRWLNPTAAVARPRIPASTWTDGPLGPEIETELLHRVGELREDGDSKPGGAARGLVRFAGRGAELGACALLATEDRVTRKIGADLLSALYKRSIGAPPPTRAQPGGERSQCDTRGQ